MKPIYFLPLGGATILLVVVLVLTTHPISKPKVAEAAPRPAAPAWVAANWREQFALDLAAGLGNTNPSPETIALIVSWTNAEDRSDDAYQRGNPLNTTRVSGAVTQTINGDGVKGYTGYQEGLAATLETISLHGHGYEGVVAGIQQNKPEEALAALYGSQWGTNIDQVAEIYHHDVADFVNRQQQATPQPVSDVRQQLIAKALSLNGIGYSQQWDDTLGFRPDCSGTMNFVYQQVAGVDIGVNTYEQIKKLRQISLEEAQDGDLWYGQYSDDQHTGMLWFHNGAWALINNGGTGSGMHVDEDFLSMPYFSQHTMGFWRALP